MSAVIASTSRSLALDVLLDWFRRHGGRLCGIALHWSGSHWGLVATRALAAGETVLQVPRQLIPSTPIVRASEMGERLQGGGVNDEHSIFAAWLARERHGSGHWRALLDAFDQDLSHLPGLVRRSEREWLQGSHVEHTAREEWVVLRERFRRVNDLLPRAERLPLRDFAWGWYTYTTQNFMVKNGEQTSAGLVPLAGMLPHSKRGPNCIHDCDAKSFRVYTTKAVAAGAPLAISFGRLSSLQLFGRYGCLREDELDYRGVLPIEVGRGHWLHAVAPHITRGEATCRFVLSSDPADGEGRRLLSLLRLLGAPSREQARALLRLAAGSTAVPFIDERSEQVALQRLQAACERSLAAFATSEAQDRALLQAGKVHGWRQQCTLLRHSEKCILQEYLRLAQHGLDLLAQPAGKRVLSPQAAVSSAPYFRQLQLGLSRADAQAAAAAPPAPNVIAFPAVHAALDSAERRLCNWFFEQGGAVHGATVRRHDGLRGMVATRDLEAGEVVMRVPRHLYLTDRTARNSPVGLALAQGMQNDVQAATALAAYIVELRRHGGRWSPMIDALPQSFNERPECFSPSAWALLEGTEAAVRAENYWTHVRQEYRHTRRALPASMRMSFRSFLWAHQTVSTRCFSLSIDGTTATGMIPVAEMFNHAVAPNCHWGGDHTLHFDVWARSPVRAGTPLTISYGSSANTRLLAQYGFCLENNECDAVKLRFHVERSHWLHELAPWLTQGSSWPAFEIGRHAESNEMRRLFSFLRLLAMPGSDAARRHPATRSAHSGHVGVVSLVNESTALQRLLEECNRRLEHYPSTREEDEALLAGGVLSPTERSAVLYRREQKRLVQEVMAHARRAQAALWLEPSKRRAALEQAARESRGWAPYFTSLVRDLA